MLLKDSFIKFFFNVKFKYEIIVNKIAKNITKIILLSKILIF